MLIKAKSKTDLGFILTLNGNQDVVVGKGVTLESLENTAIYAPSGHHHIRVLGTVIGSEFAIEIAGGDIGSSVVIDKGAEVSSATGDAILIEGLGTTVINRGRMTAYEGIIIDGAGGGTSRIDNYGLIAVDVRGVNVVDPQKVVLRNFGQFYAPASDVFQGNSLHDVVVNRGIMVGNLDFLAGDDLYDGQGGLLRGSVYGGDGDDWFRPGKGSEYLNGGDGFDTADYRYTSGIKVALDGAFISRLGALGDQFEEIEKVFGSAKGADTIRGDENANELYGFGGNDRLVGGDGVDRVIGGAGQDSIDLTDATGPFSNDRILFDHASEGGDRVTGFGGNDEIEINQAGFKGGLALGTLSAGQFKAGGNNQAGDNNDRFIFNTVNGTLWFDRDGAKHGFAPVLLIDFMDDTAISQQNITIF